MLQDMPLLSLSAMALL
jgi:hypothetical protein